MKVASWLPHLLGSFTHEHEALRVRHDLGGVEGLLKVVDELLLVALERLLGRTGDRLRRANTLLLERRQAASEDGLADEGDRVTNDQTVGVISELSFFSQIAR